MKMMRVIVAISISVLVLGFVTFVQSAMPEKESRGSRGVEKQIRESTSSNPAADAAITTAVQAKLSSANAGDVTAIEVTTEGETVYLTGTVDSAEQKRRADELVLQVYGVARVVNRLRIQGESQPETTGSSGTESQVPTDSGRRSAK